MSENHCGSCTLCCKLLDIPVFDPKKPVEGAFGCNRCHKLEATKP